MPSNEYSFDMKPPIAFLTTALFLQVSTYALGQENKEPPYHVKAQFAGDIGLVSVGAGRSFLRGKVEADLFLGYLPERVGGDRIVTAAVKATCVPVKALQVRSLDWQPLRTGLQAGHTFGREYFAFEPQDKYPKSYYGFSTAIHLYSFIGGQVDFSRTKQLPRVGIYYEAGSSAEYLISYAQNPRYLSPGKIFHLALGVRMKL